MNVQRMTNAQIEQELELLAVEWEETRRDCEGAGSPGEWIWERMDELETELERRQNGKK